MNLVESLSVSAEVSACVSLLGDHSMAMTACNEEITAGRAEEAGEWYCKTSILSQCRRWNITDT